MFSVLIRNRQTLTIRQIVADSPLGRIGSDDLLGLWIHRTRTRVISQLALSQGHSDDQGTTYLGVRSKTRPAYRELKYQAKNSVKTGDCPTPDEVQTKFDEDGFLLVNARCRSERNVWAKRAIPSLITLDCSPRFVSINNEVRGPSGSKRGLSFC